MNHPCGYTSKENEPKEFMFTFGLGNTWSTRGGDDSYANSEVGASFRPCGVYAERKQQENIEGS